MTSTILRVADIVVFGVGLLLVVISFLTYTRKGESEISKDVLITPKFIIGVLLIVASAVAGVFIK